VHGCPVRCCRCHPSTSAVASASCESCASSPWPPSPCAEPRRTRTTVPDGQDTWTCRSLLAADTDLLPWSGHSPCCFFPLQSRHAMRKALGTMAPCRPVGKARAESPGCTRAHLKSPARCHSPWFPERSGMVLARSLRLLAAVTDWCRPVQHGLRTRIAYASSASSVTSSRAAQRSAWVSSRLRAASMITTPRAIVRPIDGPGTHGITSAITPRGTGGRRHQLL
jgi:hypothetical protein